VLRDGSSLQEDTLEGVGFVEMGLLLRWVENWVEKDFFEIWIGLTVTALHQTAQSRESEVPGRRKFVSSTNLNTECMIVELDSAVMSSRTRRRNYRINS
jgi:hypothetical protein